MTIHDIYQLSIQKGIDADPRDRERVEKLLERKREKFEKFSKEEKADFDKESLVNPYSDTRILHIAHDKEIKKILVGIDIDVAEILLAKQLGDIDLVVSHHPNGRAYTDLHEVMDVQVDVMNSYGVPVNVAESLMREKMTEVFRSINPRNTWRAVDAAKLLGVNLMCLHTVADNHAEMFLKQKIEAENFERVEDVMNFLGTIEEYKKAKEMGMGPVMFSGKQENRCGNIYVGMTGGTEPAAKLFSSMAQAGIGTVISMHVAEDSRKEANMAHMNIIVTGHMSSDSIGMNLVFDDIVAQGVEIVPCSGFIRVER